jgi:hypothetical protein
MLPSGSTVRQTSLWNIRSSLYAFSTIEEAGEVHSAPLLYAFIVNLYFEYFIDDTRYERTTFVV